MASSRLSVRAARAEGALNHGANHGPQGDHCFECREEQTKLSAEDYSKAGAAALGQRPR